MSRRLTTIYRNHEPRGFALVIALVLMGFILLLLASLSATLKLETRQGTLAELQSRARQNALFGAMQALGELQHYAGADQRVSARAEILDTDPDTLTIEGVNEPYWTGIWITDPDDTENGTGGDSHQSPAAIKEGLNANPGSALAWLVSTPDANPLTNARTQTDVPLFLADGDNPDDLRNIYLPLQSIQKDGVTTDGYAWWIADDGVKASLAMDNSLVRSADDQDQAIAALTAPRHAPEFIDETASDYDLSVLKNLGTIDEAGSYAQWMGRLTSMPALEYLFSEAGLDQATGERLYRNHFHDLTILAQGVLADAREGGLKRNLSAAFSNDADFDTLKDEHGALLFGHYAQATPYDPLASDPTRATSTVQAQRRDPGGPPWEQLRSFYQMRKDNVVVQPQTNSQMGVGPVISTFQIHFHMLLMEEASGSYVVRLMIFPAVVLWNPYNATLPSENYSLYFITTGNELRYHFTPQIDWTNSAGTAQSWTPTGQAIFEGTSVSGNNHGAMRFNLTAAFAPGEAKLFLPSVVEPQNWSSGNGNTLVDANGLDFTPGGYFYSEMAERFTPTDPDPGLAYTLTLNRRSPLVPTGTLANLTVQLGLAADWPDMVEDGPLQGVGSYNHTYMRGPTAATFASWTVAPANILPATTASSESWTDLFSSHVDALGGDNRFPIIGTGHYLRWPVNLHQIYYSGSLAPVASTLASYNPRAVRNDRTPIELRQASNADASGNSLYLNGSDNRSANSSNPGSESSYWGKFYSSLIGFTPAVGYSDDTNVSFISQNTLFDLPGGPEYFQSVGSLMHASLAPPMPPTNSPSDYLLYGGRSNSDWNQNSNYPAFAIGNSVAPLAVTRDQRGRHTYETGGSLSSDPGSALYDWSYLLNDYLWDRYFFAEYDTDTDTVLNPRLSRLISATAADITSYEDASSSLMVRGAFNVNSTSVDAWRALLGGTVGAEVNGTTYANRAPYIQVLDPAAGNADAADETDAETYAGFRTLSQAEVDSLAEEIVKQVKKRGPFVSMAHFVNRVIDDPAFISQREDENLVLTATNRERVVGALEAALEASIVNQNYESADNMLTGTELQPIYDQFQWYNGMGSLSYGQPGYITQGTLLSRLGAALSPRSDTFTIRACGEAFNPLSGKTEARAWCEMVVQREPEELSWKANNRPFTIIAFRWLNEDDI